jgi:DME family drug/metabolite transporter
MAAVARTLWCVKQREQRSGVLLVLSAGVLWGTVGPAQVLAGSAVEPAALGGARILLGGLVLAAAVLATDPASVRALTARRWPALLAASAATATFQTAFLMSVAATGAAVATAVTFGITPVTTGLAERIVFGTRLSRRWTAGTLCAVLGCAVLVIPAGGAQVDVLGAAFGVVAGGCFGVYTVAAKHLIGHGAAMPAAVAVTLLIGGAVLAPWTIAALPALVTPRILVLVLWLGPITAAAAYWFFVTGLRRVSAATAGTLSLVEPLVATALALLVLGERPSAPVAAGAVLLLGGLVIVSRQGAAGRNGRSSSGPFRMVKAVDGGTSCHSSGRTISGSETTTRASSPKWANRSSAG